MNGELMHGIRFFTQEQDILSALSVACGAGDHIERALDGDCRESSVFDLASVTKLFTGLCMMKLKEDGLLDFSRPVLVYDRRFERLGDITPEQLMAFGVTVKTPARLDACQDREEALAALLAAEAGERPQRRVYSDIPAMILKYVIEAAAGMPFYEYVKKVILEPAGMTETWAKVPGERIGDCQDYNREHRIEGTRRILHQLLEVAHLVLHEEAEVFVVGEEFGDDGSRRVLAVGGTEGVVNVAVSKGGQLAGEVLAAFSLFGIEADVLKKHHFATLQLLGHSLGFATAEQFLGELHGTVHEGLEILSHRLEGEFGLEATLLGTAKVGHNDDGGTVFEQFLDGGHRLTHTGVVGNLLLVVHRDVKVHTQQHLAACKIDIFYTFHELFGVL